MAEIDDGGPAFGAPSVFGDCNAACLERGEYGMSLRDYFAAAALTGYMAWSPEDCDRIGAPDDIAHFAFKVADAMLTARQKGGR